MIDVFHGLTVASQALKLGHTTLIFATEFSSIHDDINDHFIDQVLGTANRTAVEVFLWRRTKGNVNAFPRQRLVVGLTDIVPF